MKTLESIKLLESSGFRVEKLAKNKFRIWKQGGEIQTNWRKFCWLARENGSEIFSGRELVKFADACKDSVSQPNLHKNVKKYSGDRDRTSTRDAIKKENFDIIPSKRRTHQSDLWSWD